MGNTFGLDMGVFRGHGVEIHFIDSSQESLCKTGLAGPTTLCGKLPDFWHQSQDRLQMAAAFSRAGHWRIVGPVAPQRARRLRDCRSDGFFA